MKPKIILLLILFCRISIAQIPNLNKNNFNEVHNFVGIPENNSFKKATIYTYDTELSNKDYTEYLEDLKSKNNFDELKKVTPDSSSWTFSQISFKNYLYSKEFSNFPVVCISYEAALLYCKWRENKINLKRDFSNQVIIRLPKEQEWNQICRNLFPNAIYACGKNGMSLKNESGYFIVNFKDVSLESIKKGKFPIKPINSYNPIDGGIYNLSGNVAEMLLEKGKVKGGNWNSLEKELMIDSIEYYNTSPIYVGFRPIMLIKK